MVIPVVMKSGPPRVDGKLTPFALVGLTKARAAKIIERYSASHRPCIYPCSIARCVRKVAPPQLRCTPVVDPPI
jgi:hypothetical protein